MIKNTIELIIATLLIGLFSIIVLIPCLFLIPFRYFIDKWAEKQKNLCLDCAGLNPSIYYEIIYSRPNGDYKCPSCKKMYKLSRV